jgi:Copper binding periplasmic protein CusF
MIERCTMTVGAGALAVVVAAAQGCSRRAPAPPADVYTVRGIVEQLPQPNGPNNEIFIHHMAIPGFRDAQGKVVGMMSMTMPFPVARGVSLAGIEPGDPVEFTFAVAWKGRIGHELVRIHKLPPGTVVDFNPPS